MTKVSSGHPAEALDRARKPRSRGASSGGSEAVPICKNSGAATVSRRRADSSSYGCDDCLLVAAVAAAVAVAALVVVTLMLLALLVVQLFELLGHDVFAVQPDLVGPVQAEEVDRRPNGQQRAEQDRTGRGGRSGEHDGG